MFFIQFYIDINIFFVYLEVFLNLIIFYYLFEEIILAASELTCLIW